MQRANDGWARLAYLLAVQLTGILAVIFFYRTDWTVLLPARVALGCLVAARAVF